MKVLTDDNTGRSSFPPVGIPVGADIRPLMVNEEGEIGNRDALGQVLGLIEGLDLEECVYGITATDGGKRRGQKLTVGLRRNGFSH